MADLRTGTGAVNSLSPVHATQFATTALERIQMLRKAKTIAMVGLSANPYRPSHFVAIYLLAEGYTIFPVNPREQQILGRTCYPTLRDIPEHVDLVDIFRDPAAVPPIVEDAIAIGAWAVWMQLGIINEAAAVRAREAGLQVVMDACVKIEHARFYGGRALNSGAVAQ